MSHLSSNCNLKYFLLSGSSDVGEKDEATKTDNVEDAVGAEDIFGDDLSIR